MDYIIENISSRSRYIKTLINTLYRVSLRDLASITELHGLESIVRGLIETIKIGIISELELLRIICKFPMHGESNKIWT